MRAPRKPAEIRQAFDLEPVKQRAAPEYIDQLADNEVFVFGSNNAGRHGKGAALTAKRRFGARNGVGRGRTGQCYAIATKDANLRVLGIPQIASQVAEFIEYAIGRPELVFLVTPIGCGLAGYKPRDIIPLFAGSPANVRLPNCFLP